MRSVKFLIAVNTVSKKIAPHKVVKIFYWISFTTTNNSATTTDGIYLWNGYKYKEILCGLGVDHLTHVPKTDPMTDEARPLPIALVVVITKLDFD